MDFADGGDLAKKLSARRGVFIPESQALDWFTQVYMLLFFRRRRTWLHFFLTFLTPVPDLPCHEARARSQNFTS